MQTEHNKKLQLILKKLYEPHSSELLFHGWYHVEFVVRKSLEFAGELNVNRELLEAAAFTHDLNYLDDVTSEVEDGVELRRKVLSKAGFNERDIEQIERTVNDAAAKNSGGDISQMSMALSDADKLFKVLPVGPMILSSRFITETKTDIENWADKIIEYQKPLLDAGIYFHTDKAKKKYSAWAKINLDWVEMVRDSLSDPDVKLFLEDCKKLGYI